MDGIAPCALKQFRPAGRWPAPFPAGPPTFLPKRTLRWIASMNARPLIAPPQGGFAQVINLKTGTQGTGR